MRKKIINIVVACGIIHPMVHSMDDNKTNVMIPSLQQRSLQAVAFNLSNILKSSNATNLYDKYRFIKATSLLPEHLAHEVEFCVYKNYGWSLLPWKTTFITLKKPIHGLCFSSDSQLLAVGAGNKVHIIDLLKYKCPFKLALNGDLVKKVAFLSDNKYLAVLCDNEPEDLRLDIFDIFSGKRCKTMQAPGYRDLSLYFSPVSYSKDGLIMARDDKKDIVLCRSEEGDIESLRGFQRLQMHHVCGKEDWYRNDIFPESMILTPFGATFRAASTWYTSNASKIGLLRGHSDYITDLAFDNETKYLLSSSRDKTVRLWDLEKQKSIAKGLFPEVVRSVMFSPDGLSFACGCDNGTIYLYSARDSLLHMVCKAAFHNELENGNEHALKVLYNHPLLDECDNVLKERIRSIINKQLNDE